MAAGEVHPMTILAFPSRPVPIEFKPMPLPLRLRLRQLWLRVWWWRLKRLAA